MTETEKGHSLVVAISRDIVMNHDEGDNYKCKKCEKYFVSPTQASKTECKPK